MIRDLRARMARERTACVHIAHRRGARIGGIARAAWLIAAAGVALAACSAPSSAVGTPTPQQTATPTATATPTLVYQADWSGGLTGWQASAGWSIVNGALQSDAGDNRSITIPYQPQVPDYAVAVDLQILNIPKGGGQYLLTSAPTPGKDGYKAGVYGLLLPGTSTYADHANISIYIDPLESEDPSLLAKAIHDFEPKSDSRTYRVDVRGSAVVFSVDGHTFSSAVSTQTHTLSSGPLRILCSSVEIRVSAIRVWAL
ncbi:MAG TPA: hypothetical protein VF818_10750 [Ktedonobacterales bacterium]